MASNRWPGIELKCLARKDRYGNIWIAGYQDVTVLDAKDNQLSRFRFDYSNTNYLYRNTSLLLSNGKICISVRDALAICNPDAIHDSKHPARVMISDFSVFEKSIPFTQKKPEINLSYKQNFFSISFSTFSGSADAPSMLINWTVLTATGFIAAGANLHRIQMFRVAITLSL
jgi:hypothetical protein